MVSTFPSELNNWMLPTEPTNWTLPSHSTTLSSTLPNYEEYAPLRVKQDGVKNYMKNQGTFNIGNWATEGRRMSTSSVTQPVVAEPNVFAAPPPKVKGPDAQRNYLRSRSSTPNLIYGNLDPPNPHHNKRVKKEGRANYDKNHQSQMKILLENYGKLPLPTQRMPHTQGETATNIYHAHKEGQMSTIFNNYGRVPSSPRPNPHVKGTAAEINLQKGHGDLNMLQHGNDPRPPTPEPHIKGVQAQFNYDMGHGRHVDKLFHDYGKLPQSVRAPPKVKYDGIQNFQKGQGDAMRKAISQCPPSNRYIERPQSVPLWP